MFHLKFNRATCVATLAVALPVVFAACGGASIPIVAVEAKDFSFTGPASVSGGLTRFQFKNSGAESHHMQLLKLNSGVSQEQFQNTLQSALQAAATEGEAALFRLFEVATLAGGPSGTAPGKQNEAVVDVAPGAYALVCFIAGADGVPHIAKGMSQMVTAGAGPSDRPKDPEADVTVNLADFRVTGIPVTLKTGKVTFKVVNTGQEPHEMAVVKLKGVTVEQALAAMVAPPDQAPAGPPPFEEVGGFQAIMPGQSGWATVELEKAEYLFLCFIPSPTNDFKPHLALGMSASTKVN